MVLGRVGLWGVWACGACGGVSKDYWAGSRNANLNAPIAINHTPECCGTLAVPPGREASKKFKLSRDPSL